MFIMRLLLRESLKSARPSKQEILFAQRRRRFLIKPRLQLKIAFIALVSMSLAFAVSFGVFYFFAVGELVKFNHPRIQALLERVNYALLAGFAVSSAASVLAAIYLTHKIAGPLYRFQKSMEAVGRGDLTCRVRIRKGDELKDFEESFNAMLDALREKLAAGEKLLVAPAPETPRLKRGEIR